MFVAGLGGVDTLQVFLTADLRLDLMEDRVSAEEEAGGEEDEEDGSPEASVQKEQNEAEGHL